MVLRMAAGFQIKMVGCSPVVPNSNFYEVVTVAEEEGSQYRNFRDPNAVEIHGAPLVPASDTLFSRL